MPAPSWHGGLQAIIFDFNGVIIDDEHLHYRAGAMVLDEIGIVFGEREYFGAFLGVADRELFARLVPGVEGEVLDDLVARKARAYTELLEQGYTIYPGAKELILALSQRLPLAIASGALRPEIEQVLRWEGLTACFAAVVSAEEVEACKPHPAPYLEAARRLGLAPETCLAIEDAPGGVRAAQAAGMKCVAVTTSAPATALEHAHLVIASIEELNLERLVELFEADLP